MFKLFKKKRRSITENENVSINSESIFPGAKDTLETTKQKWKTITPNEILEKIKLESSKGNRKAGFFDCYISDELVRELRSKGYRVEVNPSPSSIGPYFEIYW